MGLVIRVVVHAADIQDRDGAKLLFAVVEQAVTRLEHLWADGGYAGKLIDWVEGTYGWHLEVVKRTDTDPGFELLPRRWVAERTFAWLGRYRRLSKDYEYYTGVAEAFIYAASIHLMLRRLAPAS